MTIIGLQVDPYAEVIREVDLGTEETLNQKLHEFVFCEERGLGFHVINPMIQMAVDDMGLYVPDQRFFRIEEDGTPIAGRVVFFGIGPEGESVSLDPANAKVLREHVKWCPPTMRFVRIDQTEGWVNHPVLGRVKQFTQKAVFEGE